MSTANGKSTKHVSVPLTLSVKLGLLSVVLFLISMAAASRVDIFHGGFMDFWFGSLSVFCFLGALGCVIGAIVNAVEDH